MNLLLIYVEFPDFHWLLFALHIMMVNLFFFHSITTDSTVMDPLVNGHRPDILALYKLIILLLH